jgi:hypothetical protein
MVHNAVNFDVRAAAAFINTQVACKINSFGYIMLFQELLNVLQVTLFALRKTGTPEAYPYFVGFKSSLVGKWNTFVSFLCAHL